MISKGNKRVRSGHGGFGNKAVAASPAGRLATAVLVERLEQRRLLAVDFAPAVSYATGAAPKNLTSADIDQDGDLDLVVPNIDGGTVSILRNNGNGTFAPKLDLSTGITLPSRVAAGDINNDGLVDLVTTSVNLSGSIAIHTNTGGSVFNRSIINNGRVHDDVKLADIDGDQDLDMLLTNRIDDRIIVLSNNGAGSFTQQSIVPTLSTPWAMTLTDFTLDGDLDLVVAHLGSLQVRAFLNSGGGNFNNTAKDILLSNQNIAVGHGFFDDDNRPDLAVVNLAQNKVDVMLDQPLDGDFIRIGQYDTGEEPLGLAVADVDIDGFDDLIVTNGSSNTVSVFINTGGGVFAPQVTLGVGSRPGGVTAADFDRDGDVDIAISNENSNTVSVLLNQASKPDLRVSQLTASGAVVPGNSLPISATITNAGTNAAAASTASVFLFSGSTFNPSTAISLGTVPVGALAVNGSANISTSLVVPANTARGTYSVAVVADGANAIVELDETNNRATTNQTVVLRDLADLRVTQFSANGSLVPGGALPVSGTINNAGGAAAAASTARVFLFSGTTFNESTAIALGNISIGAVAAGASTNFSANLTVPASTPSGTYSVAVVADIGGVIAELSEANNQATTNQTVTVQSLPDLRVATLAAAGTFVPGVLVGVTGSVLNGGVVGSAPFSALVYLFAGPTFNQSTAVLLGDIPVPGLGAGGVSNFSLNFLIPLATPQGVYSVALVLDPSNSVGEQNEGNNLGVTGATVTVQERPLGDGVNGVGRPDRNFGDNGVSRSVVSGVPFVLADARVDTQGRQVTVSNAEDGRVIVSRLLPTGQIDTSFATNGVLRLAAGSSLTAVAVHVYAEGSILIAGFTNLAPSGQAANLRAFLARVTGGGAVDPSFGTSGVLLPVLPLTQPRVTAMAVAGDGSIYLGFGGARMAVVKLGGDASTIGSFGSGGVFTLGDADLTRSGIATSRGAGVAALALDTRSTDLYIAGNLTDEGGNDAGPLLVRVTAAGQINTQFARGRILAGAPGGGIARAEAITVQPAGQVVVAGSLRDALVTPTRASLWATRVDGRGNADRRFGGNGIFTRDSQADAPLLSASRIITQADGRIVLSGKVSRSLANADQRVVGSAVLRLTAAGVADVGFGNNGFSLIFSPDTVITAANVGDLQNEFADFVAANQGFISLTPGGAILAVASRATRANETTIAVVSIVADGVDLVATGTAVLPPQVNGVVVGGGRARITLQVRNNGTLPANGATNVALYLSVNSILGIEDVKTVSAPISLGSIKPGATRRVNVQINLPASGFADGTYNLFARVNDSGTIAEINDVNNEVGLVGSTAFAKPFVDLALRFDALPSSLVPGKKAQSTVSVTNRGNVAATLKDTLELFGNVTGVGVAPTRIVLGSARVAGKLNPNQTRAIKVAIASPPSLAAGSSVGPGASLSFSDDLDSSNNTIFSNAQIPVVA